MDKKLIIIDGNSLVFRAFHALPPMKMNDGQVINAAYGFFTMLLGLIDERKPDYLAVSFDLKGPTFRKEMFDDYKGNRQKTPDELLSQFPLIKEALHRLSIPILEIQGYEADDVIGTVAKRADQEGVEAYVVTGDRDSLQLITQSTKVLLTRKGVSEIEVFDQAHLKEVYGLEPWQIIDLKGLMGDASDNIPGIKGVGEKTALKLLAEFESIENLYEHLDELPGNKMKEKIVAGKESAFLSKKLATIVTDVPIAFELEELVFRGLEDQALYQVLSSLEFSSLIKRRGLAGEQVQAKEPEYFSLRKREEIERLKKEAKAAGRLALCQEGDVLYFAVKPEEEFELALSYTLLDEGLSPSDAIEQLKAILEEPAIAKTAHDAKALLHLFGEQGCQVEGIAFDTALADYVLDPTQRNFTIEKLKNRYHAAGRASALFAVEEAQKRQIKEKQLEEVYYHIELPLLYVLYSMELQGVRVNLQLLQKLKVEYAEQIDSLVKEIYELAGTDSFNIASTKQLGVVLFEKLGLPVIKKTKTGYSTDIEVLERLQGQHPIIQKLIEYRQVTKLKSTYIDGLEAVVDPKTHKVHTTFNQLVTATGRISSTEPNLQNIPVRSDFGAKIRELFIPENEENLIVAADYSQIELRVLADITNDRHLCDAFNHGEDIHTRTASEVFGVPMELVTPEMRSSSKAVNFGIVYGISDFGLAKNLGIPRFQAKEYIDKYLEEFSGVREYMTRIVEQAKRDGFVRTRYGRIRYVDELKSSNFNTRSFGERVALNTPIQGTAADIIKYAMIRVYDVMRARNLRSRLILQVHDELIVDTVPEELEEVKAILKEQMEHVCEMAVPLKVHTAVGSNWAEAK